MPGQITFIDMSAAWRRFLLVVPLVAALAGAWVGLRWCIANTMAEFAPDVTTAEAAARLAPSDPQTHLRLARYKRTSFLPQDRPEALAHYREAARLAPNDYLLWTEYGRALWEAGESEESLRVLGRAVELAPNYAWPRWHLGNTLLREGRFEEAFAELRRAADADPSLRPQVFNMAWQVSGGELQRVTAIVGNTPTMRAQLTQYLIGAKLLDDASAAWAGLSTEDKRAQVETGRLLVRALFEAKRYREALSAQRELKEAGAPSASPEKIFNGGFEAEIPPLGADFFDWQVSPVVPASFAQIAIDPRGGHQGRALRITFNATASFDFRNVSQLVVVEPHARYRLSFYVRGENLKSASTLLVEVADAAAGEVSRQTLASSAPVSPETSAWQQVTVEFTTPQTQAVIIRLARAVCPDPQCPIFGKVWYDDFDLQRLSGGQPAGARRN
ncbi:MAG TPA: tetratricopeptide repeat protein [Pyrinomonadaceae bacterium]|nr:tetratricopeptide repeat protein [Pyrinomonadaceae bacterium]